MKEALNGHPSLPVSLAYLIKKDSFILTFLFRPKGNCPNFKIQKFDLLLVWLVLAADNLKLPTEGHEIETFRKLSSVLWRLYIDKQFGLTLQTYDHNWQWLSRSDFVSLMAYFQGNGSKCCPMSLLEYQGSFSDDLNRYFIIFSYPRTFTPKKSSCIFLCTFVVDSQLTLQKFSALTSCQKNQIDLNSWTHQRPLLMYTFRVFFFINIYLIWFLIEQVHKMQNFARHLNMHLIYGKFYSLMMFAYL